MASDTLVIGTDLGGTKITTALVDSTGTLLARDYRETLASEGPSAVIARIVAAARTVMAERGVTSAQIAALGVGSPGPLNIAAGLVQGPPNLPGWDCVPLRQRLEDALGIATYLENDANAAALGEHRFGAGQGTRHMIYVTASTGIGGGLILDGKLFHGASDVAGEVGHMTLVAGGPLCGCGNRGCLEALASGTAIARRARESVAHGVPTLIAELAQGRPERINARLVAQAASQGDAEALMILGEALDYLGIGMASLVNLFNPQLIVIGGGLTNVGEALFERVRRAVARHAFRVSAEVVRVVPAALGDNVGVLGAAAVALAALT